MKLLVYFRETFSNKNIYEVAFNGSRITFAKTYIKKQKSESKKVVFEQETPITNPNQTNLLDQIEEMENE